MAQPAQDQPGTQGLAPHKDEHQGQSQENPAGPDLAECAGQAGKGLVPEEHPAGQGHQTQHQRDAEAAFSLGHQAHASFAPTSWDRRRTKSSSSSWLFSARIRLAMHSRASSS